MEVINDLNRIKYILGSFELLNHWKGSKIKSEIKKDRKLLDASVNRMRMIKFSCVHLSKEIRKRYSGIVDFDFIIEHYDESFLIGDVNILESVIPSKKEHSYFYFFNCFEYIFRIESGFKNIQNKNDFKLFISESVSNEVNRRSTRTVKKS
jgi:hypothetical protein